MVYFPLPQEDDSCAIYIAKHAYQAEAPRICVGLFSFSAPSLSLFPHSYAFLKETALINLIHLNPDSGSAFLVPSVAAVVLRKNTKELILKMAYQLAT